MNRLIRIALSLAVVGGIAVSSFGSSAQTSSTVIRVLDPSELEGIAGVILLINPGAYRKSQALVTDTKGDATARDLNCAICTVTALDPRGLFVSRTTEFSASSHLFRLVLAIQPLIDIVGDPKAVSIDLAINDSKGQPLTRHDVVIRPTLLTLEESNRLSVQGTGPTGHVNVRLRAGAYTVATLDKDSVSEAQFEISTAKGRCSSSTVTCIVASPRSSGRMKAISLELSSGNGQPKP